MKFLRMRPGYGEQLIAEGDVTVPAEHEALVEEFRRQLDGGMWAAVPTTTRTGRREAQMVQTFEQIPHDSGRVIFFPRAPLAAPGSGRLAHAGMTVALCATAIVILALLWEVSMPWLDRKLDARRHRREHPDGLHGYDPGRERRAEQRARELLRSCVNDEEWGMYRDLGFLRVWGGHASGPDQSQDFRGAPYAYLIYPHKPIVAYLPQTRQLLNEYCVEFPDETRPYGSARLPDSDDVLAKWMALNADETRLISAANMHLPGRQVDPRQVTRDLWRLSQWERERLAREHRRAAAPGGPGGSVPAS